MALKVAVRCVGNPDAVSNGGLKLTARTIDQMRRMIKRIVSLEGGKRASTNSLERHKRRRKSVGVVSGDVDGDEKMRFK